MRQKIFLVSLIALFLTITSAGHAFAAKSPTPRITEIAGAYTPNVRVHFQINPVKSGEIIKVKYTLKTRKFNDVKYKIPKKAKRSGTVNAAASSTGSAIDLFNLPPNIEKFIYEFRVRIMVPGKKWSSWSNAFST